MNTGHVIIGGGPPDAYDRAPVMVIKTIGGDGGAIDYVAGERVKTWLEVLAGKRARDSAYLPFAEGEYLPDLIMSVLTSSGVDVGDDASALPLDYVAYPCIVDCGLYGELKHVENRCIELELHFAKRMEWRGIELDD